MKLKKIQYLLFVLININCYSQQIISIEAKGKLQAGVYYTDLNNYLDTYEGTYVYSSGNVYFKMILQKKIMSNMNNIYYEDILVGAYQYYDGEKYVNNLNDLNIIFSNGENYPIDGNSVCVGKKITMCPTCDTTEKWLYMSIHDQSTHYISNFNLRKTVVNGQEAIKVYIRTPINPVNTTSVDNPNNSNISLVEPPNYPTNQEITLIKQ
jgi:hypothetical protein